MNHTDQKDSAVLVAAAARVALRVATAVIAMAGCSARGTTMGDCPFEAERIASVAVGDAKAVKISAGPGQLEVRGRDGLTEVRVQGRACAEVEGRLDRIQVVAERRGDEILIEPTLRGNSPASKDSTLPRSWANRALVDLTVDVPRSLALRVSHGAGAAEFQGVGPMEISDGSGDITIEDASGDTKISDGSGNVTVRGVRGNVVVNDGSGYVSVRDVTGGVEIEDGSGDISITQVSQDVRVSDGSGEIEIENLDAGVSIRDSSGDITIRGVGRNVEIEGDLSGDVSVSNVGGDLTVPRKCSGDVEHSGVEGSVSVPEGRC